MILYVGSYTSRPAERGQGIFCYDFDHRKGKLNLLHVTRALNPSYLSISKDRGLLFAVEEVSSREKPKVGCYRIQPSDHRLTLVDQQEIPGGFPCHTEISPVADYLIVSCYQTGNVVAYPFDDQGLQPPLANIQHNGSSVNQERQEGPHAHMAGCDPMTDGVLVCDLGLDKVMSYRLGKEMVSNPEQPFLGIPPGSGPRHLVFHPNNRYVFVLNEMSATVSVLRYENRKLVYLDSYDALPSGFDGQRSAAAIRISPDGEFVYSSNRGYDSIAIFKFSEQDESLELIDNQSSGGIEPRDFDLDPTGMWLLAANQKSNTIAVFKRNPKTGLIDQVSIDEQVRAPVCLQWVKSPGLSV